ncbi:hypothetical protein MASR1M12_42070 [Erysipelotrichia bacterium]
MKKLLIILFLMTLTGCSNPISSAVDKEGDETRAEMQTELATAKVELTEEMKRQLDQLYVNVSGQMVSLLQYFTINGGRL